ncbi:hypothetical protein [Butyricicoccus porcorum]|nr:hypothetical protein [Butyricicoccus porcorum]
MDFDCPARTVKEEVLQGAVLTAVNDAYARRNIVTALLKQNIESTVLGDLEDRLAMADKKLSDLQTQMIAVSSDEAAVDALREERQSILAEAAERSDLRERMNDMINFLDEMPQAITEYSDVITRRLVEKITIFDEKIVVELKSGLEMEVEA